MPHLGQYGPENHGSPHRLQRVFWTGDKRRRRTATDALQRGEDLADYCAATVERFADAALVVIQGLEPILRRRDLRFDCAQASGRVDQVLIELTAVGTDLLDLTLKRGLGLG